MVEAGLQHHGIQEVRQLCDVLIGLCHYYQAKDAAVNKISHSGSLDENAVVHPSIEDRIDQHLQNHSNCSLNHTSGWSASTFKDMSNDVPGDMHSQEEGRTMETSKNEAEKIPVPNVMHPKMGEIKFPMFPPYAQKVLHSQALTKRLEKKATRYLQALRERETLAEAFGDGKVLPPFVKRIKRLPIWWGEAEDADLLLGAHRHGHRNFSRIREDKSLCFSSKLDLLKSNLLKEGPHLQSLIPEPGVPDQMEDLGVTDQTEDPDHTENWLEVLPHPAQEVWPHDSVLAMRLKQLIQALRSPPGVPDRRKSKVLQEAVLMSFPEKRVTTASLASKIRHPTSAEACLLGAQQVAIPLKHSRMELSNLNSITLSHSMVPNANQTAAAMGTLPLLKPGGSKHDQKSRGKENLHIKDVMEVPNTSSEGSGDEDFQRGRGFRKFTVEPLFERQWAASHPSIMDGVSLHKKEAKKSQRPSSATILASKSSSIWMLGKAKAPSLSLSALQQPIKQVGLSTHQEQHMERCGAYQARWGTTSAPPTTFLDRDVAKRKAYSEAPLSSNKKPKESTKQQTLHGFLAPKSIL